MNENQTQISVKQEQFTAAAIKWFQDYPKVENALSLTPDKKSEFISIYFPPAETFEEFLAEINGVFTTLVEQEEKKSSPEFPFSEELVLGLVKTFIFREIDQLIVQFELEYRERRRVVHKYDIDDELQVPIARDFMVRLG
jgi:hypothetical protein